MRIYVDPENGTGLERKESFLLYELVKRQGEPKKYRRRALGMFDPRNGFLEETDLLDSDIEL